MSNPLCHNPRMNDENDEMDDYQSTPAIACQTDASDAESETNFSRQSQTEARLLAPNSGDGGLVAPKSNEGGSAPNADLAQRLFQLLNHLDAPSRRKHPATLTVLRLYCMQNLSVRQIARECHCSIGTVSHRLKLIKQQTGSDPALLRRLYQT